MSTEIKPRYEWGLRVRAAKDLFNDGSFPEKPEEALLVSEGDAGEIVQIGKQVDTGAAVYMVEFGTNMVVGCFEPEITPLDLRGEAK